MHMMASGFVFRCGGLFRGTGGKGGIRLCVWLSGLLSGNSLERKAEEL